MITEQQMHEQRRELARKCAILRAFRDYSPQYYGFIAAWRMLRQEMRRAS